MSFIPAIGDGLSIAGSLAGMFGGGDDKPVPAADDERTVIVDPELNIEWESEK